jgi:hypothetical protein
MNDADAIAAGEARLDLLGHGGRCAAGKAQIADQEDVVDGHDAFLARRRDRAGSVAEIARAGGATAASLSMTA